MTRSNNEGFSKTWPSPLNYQEYIKLSTFSTLRNRNAPCNIRTTRASLHFTVNHINLCRLDWRNKCVHNQFTVSPIEWLILHYYARRDLPTVWLGQSGTLHYSWSRNEVNTSMGCISFQRGENMRWRRSSKMRRPPHDLSSRSYHLIDNCWS